MGITKKKALIRQNIIKETLLKHKGEQNAISADDFVRLLSEYGFKIQKRSLNKILSNFRIDTHFPVCYKRGKGYFSPASDEDIKVTISDLEKQMQTLKEHIDFMRRFLKCKEDGEEV